MNDGCYINGITSYTIMERIQRIHTRHDEANLWFADGHVSSHKIESLKQLGIGYIRTENGTALSF